MGRRVPAALLLLLGTAPAAWAEGPLHVDHSLLACVDPGATRLLSDRTMLHRSDWSDAIRRNGRCFSLTPRLQLEAISRAHGLVLVRRVPPHVGEPPLYVLASALRNGAPAHAAPKPAPPAPAQAAAPATPPAPAVTPATPPAADTAAQVQAAAPATPSPPAVTAATPPPADAQAPTAAASPAATPPAATPAPVPTPTAPPPAVAPPAAAPATADTPIPDAAPPAPAQPEAAQPIPVQPAPAQPAPVWPPPPDATQRSGGGFWYGVAVTLLLLLFVLAAFLVARRRRHFAHVEEGWPPGIDLPDPVPAAAPGRPMLPPREFSRRCVKDLEFAGWTMQPAVVADGGPDLVGRRDGTLLAVRCRQSLNPITSEMVDEAARMAPRPAGALTAIVSNAPYSARARDEAGRQGILLLRDTELSGFTG